MTLYREIGKGKSLSKFSDTTSLGDFKIGGRYLTVSVTNTKRRFLVPLTPSTLLFSSVLDKVSNLEIAAS